MKTGQKGQKSKSRASQRGGGRILDNSNKLEPLAKKNSRNAKRQSKKDAEKNHNLLIHCMGKFCGATLDKACDNPTIVRWGLFRWHTY